MSVRLDSSLECDAGFDSLALVELRERLERGCRVQLPDSVLAKAETPLDWVRALSTARGQRPRASLTTPAPEAVAASEATAGPPTGAETLGAVISWHNVVRPHAVQVCLLDDTASTPQNVFEIDHEDCRAPTGAARGREPAGGPSARPSPTSPWLRRSGSRS
ncbi:MAG: phosphopantetheine-binding protein [Mycobacterium leprae]